MVIKGAFIKKRSKQSKARAMSKNLKFYFCLNDNKAKVASWLLTPGNEFGSK